MYIVICNTKGVPNTEYPKLCVWTVLGKGVKASHILGIGFYRQVASILYLGECNCTYGKIYGLRSCSVE